jgi:hypothetical protein
MEERKLFVPISNVILQILVLICDSKPKRHEKHKNRNQMGCHLYLDDVLLDGG